MDGNYGIDSAGTARGNAPMEQVLRDGLVQAKEALDAALNTSFDGTEKNDEANVLKRDNQSLLTVVAKLIESIVCDDEENVRAMCESVLVGLLPLLCKAVQAFAALRGNHEEKLAPELVAELGAALGRAAAEIGSVFVTAAHELEHAAEAVPALHSVLVSRPLESLRAKQLAKAFVAASARAAVHHATKKLEKALPRVAG